MDLLYSGNLDAFAIVSSDSDFTRLATRLRESGKTVYGLGRRRTPASLQAACDKFIFLEVLRDEADEPEGGRRRRMPTPRPTRCRTCARSWRPRCSSTAQDDGWAALGSVGNYLGKTHAAFDPRHYGFPRLSALAGSTGLPRSSTTPRAGSRGSGCGPSARPASGRTTKKTAAKQG